MSMRRFALFTASILLGLSVTLSGFTGISSAVIASAATDLSVALSETNHWEDNGGVHTQYTVTITNNGSAKVSGWTVAVTVPSGATVGTTDTWNGTFVLKDTLLTITPATYNRDIAAGESTRDIGFIIATEKAPALTATVAAGSSAASGTSTNAGSDPSSAASAPAQVDVSKIPTGDDWLHTDGNRILDAAGNEVWITGINWFGYNTGTNVFDGVWAVNMRSALASIADRGFNLLRIPISAELVLAWKNNEFPTANFNQAENAELVGMTSLEIFDLAIATCKQNGLKVMLDIHSAETNAAGHMTNLWYTDKISKDQYIDALKFLADRYKNDDTVVAYDLKNEPHGKPNEASAIWNDSTDPNNWKAVAEEAGNAVLSANPNALIMIEGIEIYPKDIATNKDFASTDSADYYFNWWGGNLRGVKDFPIDFGTPEKNRQIVYSPHDYGPAVYMQPWFTGNYTYESLQKDCWNDNWFFIQKENIAPLLIGEWGGFMTEPNLTWMTDLRKFIKENRINHTFWCFNANSGDTGGLVKDDFRTWDEEKYAFVKEVLWQENGLFVGLDHVVPLGTSGKGTNIAALTGATPVTPTTPTSAASQSATDVSKAPSTETSSASSSAVAATTSNAAGSSGDGAPSSGGGEFLLGVLAGVTMIVVAAGVVAVIFWRRNAGSGRKS